MAHSLLAMVAAPAMPRISETTFWTLPILSGRHPMARKAAGNRNTRLPSSVTSALSGLLEHTISALIFERTQMNDRSCVQSAAKRSHANTTANATKVYTPVRKSSCVAALFRAARAGVVVADSRAQMPWVDTSGQKPVVSASNLCLTKRLLKDKRPGLKNNSRHKLPQDW